MNKVSVFLKKPLKPLFKLFPIVGGVLVFSNQAIAQSDGCYGYGTSNTEEAHDVIQTSSGDILVAGETNQNSGDAFLLKFKPNGSQSIQWQQAYGTANKQEVAKAVVAHNAFYYIVGYSKASGNKDIFILQVDSSNGSVLNNKTLGGSNTDVANDMIVTKKGNLAITGQHKTTQSGNSVLPFLMTFSMTQNSFTLIREFAYGTGSTNHGNALTQDSEGDFWVVGEDLNNNGSGIIWQIEENFTNNTQSDIIYEAIITDNNNFQSLNDIEEESNHVIATGTGKFKSISSNLGAKGAYAAKIDHRTSNPGNAYNPVVRYQAFGTGNTEKAYDVATSSNGYAITGTNGNGKLLVFKIRKDFSNIKWDKVLGGSSPDRGNAIIRLSTGEFFSAGKSQSSSYNNGSGNFFLTTLSSGGANCCASSTSLKRHTLDPQKSITHSSNNSSFTIDESKLSTKVDSLSKPINSSQTGSFESTSGCGALPVEFAGFQLDQAGSSAVNITWSTASETQNNYFSVLRSRSGDNFRSVGRKDGQGTKLTSTEYKLVDDVPNPNATYYYKIRQTDFDGTTSCSNIKAINLGERSANDLSISYINSEGNTLSAHINGPAEGSHTIQLINGLGQLIAKKQLKSVEGQQSLRFHLYQQANQMIYLRVIDQQTGQQLDSKKVIPNN